MPSKRPQLKVARRSSLPGWQLVPDILEPNKWWVLHNGDWTEVRAPSYADAYAFCVGLFGPVSGK